MIDHVTASQRRCLTQNGGRQRIFGGPELAEVLARMGVGRLTLVDGDRFEESNLNRPLLSTVDGLGELKSEAAQARVWAGIHWPYDSSEGLKSGKQIGELVVEHAKSDGANP